MSIDNNTIPSCHHHCNGDQELSFIAPNITITYPGTSAPQWPSQTLIQAAPITFSQGNTYHPEDEKQEVKDELLLPNEEQELEEERSKV